MRWRMNNDIAGSTADNGKPRRCSPGGWSDEARSRDAEERSLARTVATAGAEPTVATVRCHQNGSCRRRRW